MKTETIIVIGVLVSFLLAMIPNIIIPAIEFQKECERLDGFLLDGKCLKKALLATELK